MKRIRETLIHFLFGSTVYGLIELAYRSRTHWTMLLIGGIAFCCISNIAVIFKDKGLAFKSFLGALSVTFIEFFSGIAFNQILGMKVWDYSGLPFNILGQICPYYSFLWFLICIAANYFHKSISEYLK